MNNTTNLDPNEINKFDAIAANWWDPQGEMKPLHQLNPLRMQYIQKHTSLENKKIIDVGCGGGILTESLARAGSDVVGIDLSNAALQTAKEHAKKSNLNINYQLISAEEIAQSQPASFDTVTCMEMLEHVPDPASIIRACSQLLKPGGSVFFSTINRNLKAFLLSIVGAEYILNLLPKGTHQYAKFIRPSELVRWASAAGLEFVDMQGIRYHPLSGQFNLEKTVDVNYLIYFRKISDAK